MTGGELRGWRMADRGWPGKGQKYANQKTGWFALMLGYARLFFGGWRKAKMVRLLCGPKNGWSAFPTGRATRKGEADVFNAFQRYSRLFNAFQR